MVKWTGPPEKWVKNNIDLNTLNKLKKMDLGHLERSNR